MFDDDLLKIGRLVDAGDTEPYVKAVRRVVRERDALRAEVARLSAEPDEATVERVAQALSKADAGPLWDWSLVGVEGREQYRCRARVAIRALQGETA